VLAHVSTDVAGSPALCVHVVWAVTCWLLARYALLYAGPWTVLVLVYCWPSVLAAAEAGVCMSGM
jgi:hypothetical protein